MNALRVVIAVLIAAHGVHNGSMLEIGAACAIWVIAYKERK